MMKAQEQERISGLAGEAAHGIMQICRLGHLDAGHREARRPRQLGREDDD